VDEVMFGRYRLVDVIGQGGMGTVYRAHDTAIGRDVAIKVLPPELANKPGYQERFRREAHTAARLAEPHVIPIYDTGEIDGRLYLVMPVIDGVDLSTVLERPEPMHPARAVAIIEQLGAALDTAHRAGLVHRDVKPSNALITSDDFAYLIDFGIVHDTSATKLTRTGSLIGTWAYMAPERFSTGTADARSDIYALTCVLHECLTGERPFPGDSLEQQIAGHLTGPPPRPSAVHPTLGPRFDDVIARGMAKDPQQRYQTATQLVTAAREALTGTPGPVTTPGVPLAARPMPPAPTVMPTRAGWPMPPPRRSRRRWVIPAAGAAAIAVAVAIVVAINTRGPHQKPPAARSATPTAQSTSAASTTPMAAPDQMDSMMLTAQDVNTIMGATGMQAENGTQHGLLWPIDGSLSNPDCFTSLYTVEAPIYQNSGFTADSYQELSEPGNNATHLVNQAAVSFGSADQAVALLKSAAAKMGGCAGQTVTSYPYGGSAEKLALGSVVGDVPTITQLITEPRSNFVCQRVVSAVSTVVVDVKACGFHITDQGRQIAEKMAAKVTQ
jgi:predicted Ser/Thr protein kinase